MGAPRTCCSTILALILPPLAVFNETGCSCSLLINILLTCLGFLPGCIHALFIICMSDADYRREQLPTAAPAPVVQPMPVQTPYPQGAQPVAVGQPMAPPPGPNMYPAPAGYPPQPGYQPQPSGYPAKQM